MLKSWLAAFRLKTLPLALANTIMGSALAANVGGFRWSIFILTAITTVLLQILSNLANDYGDFVNGKDNADRIGPARMVQSGAISPKTMLKAIILNGILAAISGVWLIIEGTKGISFAGGLIFALLGVGAILAAIMYTVGKNPYGYKGFGDIFVFVFFGLVGVIGTYFLHTQTFEWLVLLPAIAIGLLSTGVLNMNNLRDYESDLNAGKFTLVVQLGTKNAARYQVFLVVFSVICAIVYTLISYESPFQWLFLLITPLFYKNIHKTLTYKDSKELYPELPRLAMATLLFTLTFGFGLIF